jgi:hypothetical protein
LYRAFALIPPTSIVHPSLRCSTITVKTPTRACH